MSYRKKKLVKISVPISQQTLLSCKRFYRKQEESNHKRDFDKYTITYS